MVIMVGLPLFLMEVALGQFASLGPIAVWRISPVFKGLGIGMVTVSWLIGLYYNVVISHCVFYLIVSIWEGIQGNDLPWTSCTNEYVSTENFHQSHSHTQNTV
jgi:SNF family Na+-dependent transporter